MTAQERITEWAALADKAAEPLPDNARMDAYYYGFDRTECGPVDAILSTVATAGKRAHHTEDWGDETHGSQSIEAMIQECAATEAARLSSVLRAVPAMVAALTAVLDKLAEVENWRPYDTHDAGEVFPVDSVRDLIAEAREAIETALAVTP